jgi:cell fate regulator YaaT (PSP1 superfamily)
MCCLKYEQDAYEYLLKITPPKGALVKTREGKGTVIDIDLLKGNVKVLLQGKEREKTTGWSYLNSTWKAQSFTRIWQTPAAQRIKL